MKSPLPVAGHLVKPTEIPDEDAVVARAMTEWVFAGANGQPRRIPQQVVKLFQSGPIEG
jgi:acyl-CoA thioesterase FadM